MDVEALRKRLEEWARNAETNLNYYLDNLNAVESESMRRNFEESISYYRGWQDAIWDTLNLL